MWTAEVGVGSQVMNFKIDMEAEVTAISEQAYQTLKQVTLHKPSKMLYGPSRRPLGILGQFSGKLTYTKQSSMQDIFVVKGLIRNLLELPAITALNLAARVDATCDYQPMIRVEFPEVFSGLGNLGEPYEISLKPNAVPYALYTPRRVPFPL